MGGEGGEEVGPFGTSPSMLMARPCCSEFFCIWQSLAWYYMSTVEMQKSSLLDAVFSLNDHLVFFSSTLLEGSAVYPNIFSYLIFFILNVDFCL